MAGGGKGGKQTTSVKIPEWLEQAAQRNIARAEDLAQIGYTPYYGPEVAALTPQQVQAMQNTGAASSAFGLGSVDPMAGMPAPQTFAGGVQGYGSGGLYDQALAQLEAARPGQFAALNAPFINPVTGAAPGSPYGMPQAPAQGPVTVVPQRFAGDARDTSDRSAGVPSGAGSNIGGYTGLRDMVNGGGPGRSGTTFSGGGRLSDVANAAGISPVGSRGGSSGMGGGK